MDTVNEEAVIETSAVAVREEGGALVDQAALEAMLLADAKDVAAAEKTSEYPWLPITTGKEFVLDDEKQADPMRCIVLVGAFENSYYKTAYDSKNPTPPDCYALGFQEDFLAPPADLDGRINDKCAGCAKNEWGSGVGRGKACGNHRRLALMAPDAQNPAEAAICFLRLACAC